LRLFPLHVSGIASRSSDVATTAALVFYPVAGELNNTSSIMLASLTSLARAKSKPLFLHDLDSNAKEGFGVIVTILILMHNRASEPSAIDH
jgi:hypothetical protein